MQIQWGGRGVLAHVLECDVWFYHLRSQGDRHGYGQGRLAKGATVVVLREVSCSWGSCELGIAMDTCTDGWQTIVGTMMHHPYLCPRTNVS